jgi:AraC-like DNA-binding protein
MPGTIVFYNFPMRKNKKDGSCRPGNILLALIIFIITGCSSDMDRAPQVMNGTIDLSSAGLNEGRIVSLSGEWIFRWNEFAEAQSLNPAKERFIRVPGVWNGTEINGVGAGSYGYATYAVRITPPDVYDDLAVKIGEVATAWDLYAGDIKAASSGRTSSDPEKAVPSLSTGVYRLPEITSPFYLVLHVSNYHYYKGGPYKNIYIGREKDLLEMSQSGFVTGLFLFGMFIFAGIYHFVLYYFRRSDRAPLVFGILCLLIGFYNLTTGDIYFNRLFPDTAYNTAFRFVFFSIYAALPFFAVYLESLFNEGRMSVFIKALAAASILLCLVVLITPARIFSETLPVFHFLTVITAVYSVFLLARAVRNKMDGALLFTAGVVILFAAAVNDIAERHDIVKTRDMVPFGAVVVVISQGIFLASRHSRTLREKESLEDELKRRMAELDEARQYMVTAGKSRSSEEISPSIVKKLEEALAYINDNYRSDISREGLAAKLDLHPDNFGRFFKIYTGRKTGDLINELRIRDAAELLISSDKNILEIALEVGFESLRTFNRAFLTVYGIQPSEFRKNR